MLSIYLAHVANSNIARKCFRLAKVFSDMAHMIGLKLFLQVLDSVLGAWFLVILQVKHCKITRYLRKRKGAIGKPFCPSYLPEQSISISIFHENLQNIC